MNCGSPVDALALLKGGLPESERTRANAHLAGCAECSTERDRVAAVMDGLASLRAETIEASGDLRWRVRAALIEAHPEILTAGRPAASLRSAPIWALAAILQVQLIAIVALVMMRSSAPDDGEAKRIVGITSSSPEAAAGFHAGAAQPFDGALWVSAIRDGRLARLAEHRRSAATDRLAPAIGKGLEWLASIQQPDGSWDSGSIRSTGLALLAFLGNGETATSGPHAASVRRGVDWLLARQRATGLIGDPKAPDHAAHAIAATALLEARLMAGDEDLRSAVDAAVAFSTKSQASSGGWDAAADAWQAQLLRLALAGGDRSVIPALNALRDSVQGRSDAAGAVARLFSHPHPTRSLAEAVSVGELPSDPASISTLDLEAWRHAAVARRQSSGDGWADWSRGFLLRLSLLQSNGGSLPAGVEGTALALLTLESGWSYPVLID